MNEHKCGRERETANLPSPTNTDSLAIKIADSPI